MMQWEKEKTKNGFLADVIISALQKTIRRGDEETAVRVAYEMAITDEALEEMLWRRLAVITVEDIGFGNPDAPVYLNALDQLKNKFEYGTGDRILFAVAAVRYLCACEKERSNDHLKGIISREFAGGKFPKIPDVAYDMHTQKGREMGRDLLHFLKEASEVSPEHPLNLKYRTQLIEIIEKNK